MVTRAQLLILWSTALLVIFFLVHPHYDAQLHGSEWEDASELDQSAWVWSPPEATLGFRFRPDRARQLVYCLAALILGASAFVTARWLPALPARPSKASAPNPARTQRLARSSAPPANWREILKAHPRWCQTLAVTAVLVALLHATIHAARTPAHLVLPVLFGGWIGGCLALLFVPAIPAFAAYGMTVLCRRPMFSRTVLTIYSVVFGTLALCYLLSALSLS